MATASKVIRLPYKYEPRGYQVDDMLKPLDEGFRRIICIWHRRTGKDKTAWNVLPREGMKEVGNYFYIFPSAKQGRKAVWEGIDNDGMRFLDHIPEEIIYKINDNEMRIILTHPDNPSEPGSTIQIVGGDSYNNVMGSNPKGVVFSEYSLINPLAWSYIRPILKVNGGWAIFIYTPRGNNHGKDLYDMALKNLDTWHTSVLTIDDTGVLTEEDIKQEMREGMSWEMVQQEYYCSFEAGVPGAYYGRIVAEARNQKRIVPHLPLEPGVPIYTSWDIGIGDSTAIWFYQIISPREIRVVDYYENNNEDFDHYAGVLQHKALERKWTYGRHIGPHDLKRREQFAGKRTRVEIAREAGIDFDIAADLTVEEGIENVRGHFSKFYFDAVRCEQGIKALENYRKKYDDVLKRFDNKPLHDWASDGADAFRYFCVELETMVKLPIARKNKRIGIKRTSYASNDPFRRAESRKVMNY